MNLFTNGNGVFGDFGILEVPFQFAGEAGMSVGFFEFDSLQMDEVNYLQKGEKILSLLRAKRPSYCFKKDNVLEMIKYKWSLTQSEVAKKIGTKLEKEFLQNFETAKTTKEGYESACKELGNKLSPMLEIKAEGRGRELHLMSVLCKNANKATINIRYGDVDAVLPVGATFSKSREGGCKLTTDPGEYINVRIFKRYISELYLRHYLLNKLREIREESGSSEEYSSHRVIGKLQAAYEKNYGQSDFEYVRANMFKPARYSAQVYSYAMVLFYPETEEAAIASFNLYCGDVQEILYELHQDYKKIKYEAKMEKEISREHAKSFQTKRNIPQKYVRAMSRSGFNKYFGYIEFDEECDLKLMEELYKEYEAFAKEMDIGNYPEVSLRFRKLGNHKASGLYYYIMKCLCVDVRSPGSMVHEVGHMIDYHMNHISIKFSFQSVYDRYEFLLKEYLKKADKKQADVLKGKSKYNLDYYLQPTEVFARCFEMYVVKIRGIDNSLCRPDGGFAYPEDEKLMELIKIFYDGILKKEKENVA